MSRIEERARESRFATRECDAGSVIGLGGFHLHPLLNRHPKHGGRKFSTVVSKPFHETHASVFGLCVMEAHIIAGDFMDRLPRVLNSGCQGRTGRSLLPRQVSHPATNPLKGRRGSGRSGADREGFARPIDRWTLPSLRPTAKDQLSGFRMPAPALSGPYIQVRI